MTEVEQTELTVLRELDRAQQGVRRVRAKNHHFVSQGYLAGFTEDGTRNGRLFVAGLVSRRVFPTNPRNVGAERDFNRIEADGYDPDTLERQLGEFESTAISVIRGIQASGELPADEELSYVINLMALLVVRNPRSRRTMNTASGTWFASSVTCLPPIDDFLNTTSRRPKMKALSAKTPTYRSKQ